MTRQDGSANRNWKRQLINLAAAICLAWIWLCPANPASAADDIYCYVDEQGVYHYSNVPTSPEYVPTDIGSRNYYSPAISDKNYDDLIHEAAAAHGLEFALIKAMIRAESAFNPRAVSHAGAMGLMQIMPANLNTLNLSDPFDPGQNIKAGTLYLKRLLARYDEDLDMALAAYNAGPGVVDYYRGIPPYKETQDYVERVRLFYNRYTGNQ